MKKYHKNPKTGKVSLCKATKRPCSWAIEEDVTALGSPSTSPINSLKTESSLVTSFSGGPKDRASLLSQMEFEAKLGLAKKANGKGDISKELEALYFYLGSGAVGYSKTEINEEYFPLSSEKVNSLNEALAERFGVSQRTDLINAYVFPKDSSLTAGVQLSGSGVLDLAVASFNGEDVEKIKVLEAKGGSMSLGPSNQGSVNDEWRISDDCLDRWGIPPKIKDYIQAKDFKDYAVLHSNFTIESLIPSEDYESRKIIEEIAYQQLYLHYKKKEADSFLVEDGGSGFREIPLDLESLKSNFDAKLKVIGLVNPKRLSTASQKIKNDVMDAIKEKQYLTEKVSGGECLKIPMSDCKFRSGGGELLVKKLIDLEKENPSPLKDGVFKRIFPKTIPVFYNTADSGGALTPLLKKEGEELFILLPMKRLCIANPKLTMSLALKPIDKS